MSEDWVRLGAAVREAREAKRLTQAGLGAEVGVGETTVANVERARTRKVTPTLRSMARVLGWTPDSIEAVLAGGSPTAQPDIVVRRDDGTVAEIEIKKYAREGMPLRIAQALTEGSTLDTTIVPLGPGADMVVVVKGRPTASPEELRAALLAWEKREGHLERLGLVADDEEPRGEGN
jgi:transcriptional regulator with XRE-family HTH domain